LKSYLLKFLIVIVTNPNKTASESLFFLTVRTF